jgi:hypothetical protein
MRSSCTALLPLAPAGALLTAELALLAYRRLEQLAARPTSNPLSPVAISGLHGLRTVDGAGAYAFGGDLRTHHVAMPLPFLGGHLRDALVAVDAHMARRA